ncbi:hypothetical protein EXN66_Car010104 [Xyrichtys novacula]|uniref:Uncharacterized protein n=1 Tax=Xyrichtys novacula TaxID=13765 RepID=A0AAV1H1E0_XYRNO|nr:hypothetical protein EXN66_Car010104 [Xyrichtys novacula]
MAPKLNTTFGVIWTSKHQELSFEQRGREEEDGEREREREEEEEEEKSSEMGKDAGGGRRGCESSWGEEAELTHKGGRSFISREKTSHESLTSSVHIRRASERSPQHPAVKKGFLRLLSRKHTVSSPPRELTVQRAAS